MAVPNTAIWRVRAGGSNVNGGGYDPSAANVQSTTLNGAISAGDTTIEVISATGWPSSGNYYARIGNIGPEIFSSGGTGSSEVVLVTSGQGTTTWTVTRGALGTVAQAFATGAVVDNSLVKDVFVATNPAVRVSRLQIPCAPAAFGTVTVRHIGGTEENDL